MEGSSVEFTLTVLAKAFPRLRFMPPPGGGGLPPEWQPQLLVKMGWMSADRVTEGGGAAQGLGTRKADWTEKRNASSSVPEGVVIVVRKNPGIVLTVVPA